MNGIAQLHCREAARLDRDRLEHLVRELGEPGAERVVGRAMEELAVRLQKIGTDYGRNNIRAVEKSAHSLIAIADQIGMSTLARVARDVVETAGRSDATAMAATVGRLQRVGEASLMSIWDIQDMTI